MMHDFKSITNEICKLHCTNLSNSKESGGGEKSLNQDFNLTKEMKRLTIYKFNVAEANFTFLRNI